MLDGTETALRSYLIAKPIIVTITKNGAYLDCESFRAFPDFQIFKATAPTHATLGLYLRLKLRFFSARQHSSFSCFRCRHVPLQRLVQAIFDTMRWFVS